MKSKIRKSYFETNSSSVHAIVLPKSISKYIMPSNVDIYLIDNLSEKYPFVELLDKLNFLITILYVYKSGYEINYLIEILENCSIRVNIADNRINEAIYNNSYDEIEIDDINSAIILVRKILYNDELLLKYLFGDTIVDYDFDSSIYDKYNHYDNELLIR